MEINATDVVQALLEQGALTAEQAQQAQEKATAGEDLYAVLVGQKIIDEEVFTQAQAQAAGLSYVDLHGVEIPHDVLAIIPESTAREHAIIAYAQTAQELQVAMTDPRDRQIVEFIRKKVDQSVTVALASPSSIRTTLAQYQQSLDQELQQVLATVTPVNPDTDLTKAAEDLPIIRIIDLALKHAIFQNASDIHIEPTEQSVIIRFRKDGLLHDMLTLAKEYLPGLIARIKVLSRLKIDEHRLPQDGRFKIESDDYKVAFRVSILPVFDGEKVVMRLLDESGRGLDLGSMGMRPHVLEVFRRNVQKPHGMILVTGPTGSGKTTTLYAAMREVNTPDVNISTVEDPIEYRMERINQTQVNPQIGLTFANGLRSLVRQDPDILMVGEIRDEETASLAVNAALTGHLVLSTLHTNSAAGALPRLLDMGVEAFLVASTVNILLAQRLVRRLCPSCRQERKIDENLVTDLKRAMDTDRIWATLQREKVVEEKASWTDLTIYDPQGCSECNDGYKGRVGIYELIEFSEDIRPLVTPQVTSDQLEHAAREKQQMISMLEDGFIKIVEGATSMEEVLRVAKE